MGLAIYHEWTIPKTSLDVVIYSNALPRSTVDRLGGISWESRYVDSRIAITNNGEASAENISEVFHFDASAWGIGQVSDISEVQSAIVGDFSLLLDDGNGKLSSWKPDGAQRFGPDARVFCSKLQPHEKLEFVVAIEGASLGSERKPLRMPKFAKYELRFDGVGFGGNKNIERIEQMSNIEVRKYF